MPIAFRLACVALLVALVQLPLAATRDRVAAAGPGRPNVLIIVTDDQRAMGTMNVMPATRRWFGRGGTRFSRAFATTPLCCPARATIMTGRYSHNHGVRHNYEGAGGAHELDEGTTIQRYLDDAGYRTALFGKFLNHWGVERDPAYFDEWGFFESGYWDEPFNINGEVRRVRRYTTNVVERLALRFLRGEEERDGRPWYLYVAPFAPHLPAAPEPRYARASVPPWRTAGVIREDDRSDKPEHLHRASFRSSHARTYRKLQLRTLMSVDDLIGRVAMTLRRLGEARDTLAFFVSDNGFALGDRGWLGKSLPYTESIRVPMFMRWPAGGVSAGRTSRRIVGNVDIAPTIVDAAGLAEQIETPMDGRSLVAPWRRPWILTEFWGADRVAPWASLRGRRYQYVEYFDSTTLRPVFAEYYDLRRDRRQLRNLLGDDDPTNDPPASRLARLSTRLARARRCFGASTTGLGCS